MQWPHFANWTIRNMTHTLLGMRMPELDGKALFEKIKEQSAVWAARIIFATGGVWRTQPLRVSLCLIE